MARHRRRRQRVRRGRHRRCRLRSDARRDGRRAARQRLPLLHGRRRPRQDAVSSAHAGAQADRPRRIVVETTGLADPVPLLHTPDGRPAPPPVDPPRRRSSATVDAVNGLRNLDDQQVAARQAAVADRRLVTKADLGEAADVEALLRSLSRPQSRRRGASGQFRRDRRERIVRRLAPRPAERPSGYRTLAQPCRPPRAAHRSILAATASVRFSGEPASDAIGTWLLEEEAAGRLGNPVAASRRHRRPSRRSVLAAVEGRDPHRGRSTTAGHPRRPAAVP